MFLPSFSGRNGSVFTFTGNGNWSDPANWLNNEVPPADLPAGSEIIINHAANGQCILDTPQKIAAGSSITVASGKNLQSSGWGVKM